MTEKIFLIQSDESLITVDESPFESEDLFQELLARHPDLLAGDQVRSSASRRWLLVTREMGIPDSEQAAARWSIDHLYLDLDGTPTLVEVKRSSDTRVRREVVGQMLDYAANAIVYWPPSEIEHQFQLRCEADGLDPDIELTAFLGDSDLEVTEFWGRVKTNLQARKIRMLFVTDRMPRELKRIIEFLNEQMDPAEVLGLELRHHSGSGVRVLVPQIVGQTEAASTKKASSAKASRQWDHDSIINEILEERGPKISSLVERFLERCGEIADTLEYGKGGTYGRCSPVVFREEHGKKIKYPLVNLWAPYGTINVHVLWRRGDVFGDPVCSDALRVKIGALPGTSLSAGAPERWVEIRLEDDSAEATLDAIVAFVTWAAETIRTFGEEP